MTLNGNINQNRVLVIFLFPACVGERFAVSPVHEAGKNRSYFLSQKFMTAQYVHKSILWSHRRNNMTSAVCSNSTLQSLNSGNWWFASKHWVQAAFSFQHRRKWNYRFYLNIVKISVSKYPETRKIPKTELEICTTGI